MKVCVFGSLNLDQTYYVDHINEAKETASCEVLKISAGGKGLNQAIALSKAKADVYMAGCIGNNADFLVQQLKDNQVNIDELVPVDKPNGHAIIQVDKNGQNSILVYPGSNYSITEEQVKTTLSKFGEGDLLVLQNEINQLSKIMEIGHEKGMKIAFNPSPIKENLKDLPLHLVDYFFVNEIEAQAICDSSDVTYSPSLFKIKYPNAKVILTLGENGSILIRKNGIVKQNAYHVDHVVDTVGAGDTFMGFFLGAVVEGKDDKRCLLQATAASTLCIQKEGASTSVPSYDEIIQFLNLNK